MKIYALEIDCTNLECKCGCCPISHFNLIYVKNGEIEKYTCDNCNEEIDILYTPLFINTDKGNQ